MDAPEVIRPGERELVGDAPDRRLEILCEDDAVHATCARLAAGRDGADLHIHRHHTDVFYVLEGELTVRLGVDGESVVAPAGTLALVPPLVVHGFRNGSEADMRYLNVHAPGLGFADYLRGLRDGRAVAFDQEPPPAEGTRPTSEVRLATADGRESTVLADRQELTVAEVRAGPDRPPLEARHGHVQSFYVLEGELRVTSSERALGAPAGSWVHVPPGVAHRVAFSRTARLLDLRAPAAP